LAERLALLVVVEGPGGPNRVEQDLGFGLFSRLSGVSLRGQPQLPRPKPAAPVPAGAEAVCGGGGSPEAGVTGCFFLADDALVALGSVASADAVQGRGILTSSCDGGAQDP
jgi:hypothetical protein